VQAYINDEWDAHDDIRKNHDAALRGVGRPDRGAF